MIFACRGVDLFSGRAVGNHYAADDFTLFKTARYYLSLTADFAFLDQRVQGSSASVLDAMVGFATSYRDLSGTESHLADYGAPQPHYCTTAPVPPAYGFSLRTHTGVLQPHHCTTVPPHVQPPLVALFSSSKGGLRTSCPGLAANLLECVPTYQHKVASFNAASVWMLEQLASLLRERSKPGDSEKASQYAKEAAALAKDVLSLYHSDEAGGSGYWDALYPNGSRVGVRHVIDFVYVSEFMSTHLSPQIKREVRAQTRS
eukprot:SAG11_NODE_2348_length_3485_cov_1.358535_2_plen_259_part_00